MVMKTVRALKLIVTIAFVAIRCIFLSALVVGVFVIRIFFTFPLPSCCVA